MKTCSILISNYNSFESIQLCIESVRKHTKYPHKIIVYDDCSTNKVDLEYLRDKASIGWIELIEGKERINHGGALNVLINESGDTDLSMILDNDIQILRSGWLEDMVNLINEKTLIVVGIEYDLGAASAKLTYPDWFQTWFMMINMNAYRDRMEVDWVRSFIDKNTEPFRALVEHYDKYDKFDLIHLPVGAKLYNKILNDNPKGYEIITPIPDHILRQFHHVAHVSCLATRASSDPKWLVQAGAKKLEGIREKLNILRGE